MRSDEIKKITVVLMKVAIMVQQGEKVTCDSVYGHLFPSGVCSRRYVVSAIGYLTSIGAIVWDYRSHGRKAGKVKMVRPERFTMRWKLSRSATERELKASAALYRYDKSKRVICGESLLTDDLIAAFNSMFPDKKIDIERFYQLIDGYSFDQAIKLENS